MLSSAAMLAAFSIVSASAQSGTKNGEWRTYGGDLGSTRYAPLDQINAKNFDKLEVAWRFKTDYLGPRPEYQYEGTPLMIKGILYCTGGSRRAAFALDAATGELLWTHAEKEGPRGQAAPRQLSGHGLAYWTDGKEERIIYVTPGYRMVALNAKDGQLVKGFGVDGIVDLKLDDDQEIDLVNGEIGLHSTPVVAGDVVIVGAAHRSGGVPRTMKNAKGYVRGFDARTGKRLWIFHTLPKPGEFGIETWLNDSWAINGNTGVWAQISVDEQLGMAYLPVELPTGDYYGGHRPGNGLFGESLVAVDLKTGVRKWHYQFVHHGIWDMDIPCAPILADITVNGKLIKAVAQPTKQSFLYVFDRTNGQPVWPIEEKPVPQGDVPGEWYSKTQPFPSKPPAYDQQGVTPDALINFTPALHEQALKAVEKYRIGPIFTPPSVSKIDGPLATLIAPGALGGSNWPGGAYDPELHNVYVFSQSAIATLGLVPPTNNRSDMNFIQGSAATGPRTTPGAGSTEAPIPAAGRGAGRGAGTAGAADGGGRAAGRGAAGGGAPGAGGSGEGGGPTLSIQGLPLLKPPYGRISAINLDRGEIVWQTPHGETPDNIKNNPALKGIDIPRTGRPGIIGTLVTKSLVVAGEAGFFTTPSGARGAMLRAYDKNNGKEVGAVYIPAPQSGSPMTYMVNGQQYIVVAISGASYSGELVAFKLPNS
jgi:quinoprotein glucose dehydrogenase